MSTRERPRPSRPRTAQPPERLVRLSETLRHPDVAQTGLTTTSDGRWALLVKLRRGTAIPVADIEALSPEDPVIYDREPENVPVARPAYPAFGE